MLQFEKEPNEANAFNFFSIYRILENIEDHSAPLGLFRRLFSQKLLKGSFLVFDIFE